MLKLIALLLAITLITVNGSISFGGYGDRPDLIQDAKVRELVNYATEHLASTQNLVLNHIRIQRVQTQVVAGMNYKIGFIGESVGNYNSGSMDCQAVIYVR